jgi:hypothetical protein
MFDPIVSAPPLPWAFQGEFACLSANDLGGAAIKGDSRRAGVAR